MKEAKPIKTLSSSRRRVLACMLIWICMIPFFFLIMFIPILNIIAVIFWIFLFVGLGMELVNPTKIEMYKSYVILPKSSTKEVRLSRKGLEIRVKGVNLILRDKDGNSEALGFAIFSKKDLLKFFEIKKV